ncbi:hypothetical protein BBJ28_00002418 [Nothophytophthora sp. Chile5]|nr:hypothetical protein BBJ28_00002418 [Nothophytophthora sp. Chile5]
MHQKAAMAEEAGAKGVIFIQRVGEKPLPVRLPPVSELPRAIRIPLAMVSIDSGTQLLEQMSTVRPDETQQLRFVFSAACEADRFSVHPEDGDPLRRSAAFLIDAASAGFLSVSVASSAETELLSDAYEFLKPADYSSATSSSGVNLPLGKHDLYFPDARIFDPCETDPMRISPLVRSRQSQMVDTFVAVRLRDPKGERGCSLIRQLVYLEAKHPAGIILGDPQFPHAASSLAAVVAVQQLKVPVVFISINAFRTIRCLASLAVPTNWPASEAVRDRLFHRMLKDQATVDDHDLQLALVKNERYEALVASYWNAQRYYTAKVDDGHITLEEDERIDLEEER